MKHLFGGKGTGLIWLAMNTDLGYSVPPFDIIDTNFYEEFLKQPKIAQLGALLYSHAKKEEFIGTYDSLKVTGLEKKCEELFQRFKGKDVAIRSSAVYSEDDSKHSGAGLYETHFLGRYEKYKLTPENLMNAVLNIYMSVNNPTAVRYRKENNIPEEKMAVVIQQKANEDNGVVFSRLPGREGIVPMYWSSKTGAAVGGALDNSIERAHFLRLDQPDWKGLTWKTIFHSENIHDRLLKPVKEQFMPILEKLKERYGKDIDVEFCFDLPAKWDSIERINDYKLNIQLVQIRPLTNITNKIIKFPHRKAIFKSTLSLGVGEYIGPWKRPGRDVCKGWDEPSHYAYVASHMEKSAAEFHKNVSFLLSFTNIKPREDYDRLSPNKKAIILTKQHADPGMHALTIANEKGLLCLTGYGKYKPAYEQDHESDPLFRDMMVTEGMSPEAVRPVHFDVPMNEVSKYIRIVSDGVIGKVYNATKKQAIDFAKKNGLFEPK